MKILVTGGAGFVGPHVAADARARGHSVTLADVRRIRREVAASLVVWLVLAWWLGLTWQAVIILYAAFALSWSSLQWIYHVRTPLDVVEGAYNLRAPWLVRSAFLFFNYNLTHHREPTLRWQELRGFWLGDR